MPDTIAGLQALTKEQMAALGSAAVQEQYVRIRKEQQS
jgi:hypothetical protein